MLMKLMMTPIVLFFVLLACKTYSKFCCYPITDKSYVSKTNPAKNYKSWNFLSFIFVFTSVTWCMMYWWENLNGMRDEPNLFFLIQLWSFFITASNYQFQQADSLKPKMNNKNDQQYNSSFGSAGKQQEAEYVHPRVKYAPKKPAKVWELDVGMWKTIKNTKKKLC